MINLDSKNKLKGEWWLPENPECKIYGELIYDQDNIELELVGLLSENSFITPDIILGNCHERLITLYKSFEYSHGETKSKFSSQYVIIGNHYSTEADIIFTSLNITFSNFEHWFNKQPFQSNFIHDETGNKTHIEIVPYKIHEIKIESIKTSLTIIQSIINDEFDIQSIKYTNKTYIKITPDNSENFNWYFDTLNNLQDFFTIIFGHALFPKNIENQDISIHYRLNRNSTPEPKYFHSNNILFNYNILEKNLESIVNNWFSNINLLSPICELFLSMIYNPDNYLNLQFIALMQAIESFHRKYYNGKYISDDDYKPYYEILVKSIPEDITSDHRQSLKSRLYYGNEYSLRKRFSEILKQFEKGCLENFNINSDFIGQVVDLRNNLTHFDSTSITELISWDELHLINEKLKLILHLCLLEKSGIAITTIYERVNVFQKFKPLKQKK